MIVVKTDIFSTNERLARYINENNIKREDILTITGSAGGFAIFFYGDSEVKEITHGLFD
jgi:hypothetical protein